MLSSLVKKHACRQAGIQERAAGCEEGDPGSSQPAHKWTHRPSQRGRFAVAYLNQKRLEHKVKELHLNATNFAKQTAPWLQMIEGFNTSLKELGDVENWARSTENDMKVVSSERQLKRDSSDLISC